MMTIGPYPLALERGSCTREFTTPWVSGRAGGVGECPRVADNRAAQYWFRSSCIRTVTMVTEAEGLEKERVHCNIILTFEENSVQKQFLPSIHY